MGNKAKSKIGTPPEQWPLTTAAVTVGAKNRVKWQRRAKCGGGRVGTENCVASTKTIADAILKLVVVDTWIKDAGEVDLQDRRACSLVTVCGDFFANAKQPWKTPSEHKTHYQGIAKKLRRLGKVLQNDKMPAVQNYAEDLERAAITADHVANIPEESAKENPRADLTAEQRIVGACYSKGWVKARPNNNPKRGPRAHAARNDFVRALSKWMQEVSGGPKHALVAAINNAMFTNNSDQLEAKVVQELSRKLRLPRKTPQKALRR